MWKLIVTADLICRGEAIDPDESDGGVFGSLGLRPLSRRFWDFMGPDGVHNSNYCSPSSATISFPPQWSVESCPRIFSHWYSCFFPCNSTFNSNELASEDCKVESRVLFALFTVWVFSIESYSWQYSFSRVLHTKHRIQWREPRPPPNPWDPSS